MTTTDYLDRIEQVIDNITKSQGWREAVRSDDPGNVTVWIGPRLGEIVELARAARHTLTGDGR